MKDWFTIDKMDDDTYIISEYRHWEETHCYLLNGTEHSLLIDTGLGICNISEVVSRLTDKPVVAVATHIHWDHIATLAPAITAAKKATVSTTGTTGISLSFFLTVSSDVISVTTDEVSLLLVLSAETAIPETQSRDTVSIDKIILFIKFNHLQFCCSIHPPP